MPLPKEIQRQADQVAAFEASLNQPAPPVDEIVETPPEIPPQPAEKPQATPPADPRDNDVEYWKQRFQTVQGFLDQSNERNRDLTANQQALQTQLAALSAQVAALSKPQTPAAQDDDPLVTDKDAEMFGADLVDMSKRAAKQETRRLQKIVEAQSVQIERLVAALDATGKRVESMGTVQAKTDQERFMDSLNARMPNWEEIQNTPECQQWLLTTIPGTTLTWDNVIQTAAQQHNVGKVIEVFDQFKQAYPQYATPPAAPTQPAAPRQTPRDELARQVAPNKSATAQTQTPQTQQFMTAGDFEAMGMRVVRLKQQGKHQEAAELEAQMDAALAGGRVR